MISENDVIKGDLLSEKDVFECIDISRNLLNSMRDREDLHDRAIVERYNDILMGELAERAVLNWLVINGVNARSAVDKSSGKPDGGHDIIINDKIKCSVKSSLSYKYSSVPEIIKMYTVATTENEIRDVNIQVYFWLNLKIEGTNFNPSSSRVSVPSEWNMAIIGWLDRESLIRAKFDNYKTEKRTSPKIHLCEMRPINDLLGDLSTSIPITHTDSWKCPHCGGDVSKGPYGYYCKSKCGMNFYYVFGVKITDEQVKCLLDGCSCTVMTKNKKATTVLPECVETLYEEKLYINWRTK